MKPQGIKEVLVVVVCAVVTGCSRKQPAVVVDDWWNVDYAKNGCQLRSTSAYPCVGDPVAEVREFETELGTFFATDPACQGVVLVNYRGPNSKASAAAAKADGSAEWQLMMDFNLGDSVQSWSMVRRADSHMTSGKGSPKEMIHTVCGIAKQIGGSVVN